MLDAAQSADPAEARRFTGLFWAVPVGLLVLLWLLLAFSSGGFQEHQWLPGALATAFLGVVAAALVAYPRRPRQLSLAVLALLLLYAVWVAVSWRWAGSKHLVWEEINRTFFYLLVLTLALMYLTAAQARVALRYLLMLGAVALLLLTARALWQGEGDGVLFIQNRFQYPVSYPNNAAALFLILFWPLLWVAADPREWVPIRGLALAICASLLAPAILTQSRGGFYAAILTGLIYFLLSPARLRSLFFLLPPVLLLVWSIPTLADYWREGPQAVGGSAAVSVMGVSALMAGIVGIVLALLENWIAVSRRMRLAFGSVTLIAVIVLAVWGFIQFDEHVGGARDWAAESWDTFVAEGSVEVIPGTASEDFRIAALSASGRIGIWRDAWTLYELNSTKGVGANNFIYAYDRIRTTDADVRQPHSLQLRLLSETGAIGALLFFSAVLVAVGGILVPRFGATFNRWRPPGYGARRGRVGDDPQAYAWPVALLMGFGYWGIQGSVDWLWHMPGVTVPALLVLGLALAETDALVGEFWPRAGALLAGWGKRLGFGAETPSEAPAVEETNENLADLDTGLHTGYRRSERHESKAHRRVKRKARRERLRLLLQPYGLLSHLFRGTLLGLSLALLGSLAFPYLAIRYTESALSASTTDKEAALDLADTAAGLNPLAPEPLFASGAIHRTATRDALSNPSNETGASPSGSPIETAQKELEAALVEMIRGIEREPVNWALYNRAGEVALAQLAVIRPDLPYTGRTESWAELALPYALPQADAGNSQALLDQARSLFEAARERNPRAVGPQRNLELIVELTELVKETAPATDVQ